LNAVLNVRHCELLVMCYTNAATMHTNNRYGSPLSAIDSWSVNPGSIPPVSRIYAIFSCSALNCRYLRVLTNSKECKLLTSAKTYKWALLLPREDSKVKLIRMVYCDPIMRSENQRGKYTKTKTRIGMCTMLSYLYSLFLSSSRFNDHKFAWSLIG